MMKKIMIIMGLTLLLGSFAFGANITNTASGTGTDLNDNAITILDAQVVTTYKGLPAITLSKSAQLLDATGNPSGRSYVIGGDKIQYTITVTNTQGCSSPKTLIVKDLIPTNTTYNNGHSSKGGAYGTCFSLLYTTNNGGSWSDTELAEGAAGNGQNGVGLVLTAGQDFSSDTEDAVATFSFRVNVLTQ